MITSLLLSLAVAASADLPPSPVTSDQLRDTCLQAIEGDVSSEADCSKVIRLEADLWLVDELNPDFQTTCLVIDTASTSDLIWLYLEWLEEHPGVGGKPASTTVNAALLEKLPCGWREQ